MKDLIFRSATRFLLPLMLLFSVFLLLRGHDAPGGGFAGGLVAAGAFTLLALAEGVDAAVRLLKADSRTLGGVGLLIALASGVPGLLAGRPFLTGRWWEARAGPLGTLSFGTPLLFDIGVYLVVLGASLTVILSLLKED
jgi:multicomponent Na+:H+ antiporter subunit B